MPQKKVPLIDTNVILRYLLNDVPEQSEASSKLMEKLISSEEVYLHDVVIAELVWTLEKFYQVPKSKIRKIISELLLIKGLLVSNRSILLKALELFAEKNIDFADALIASMAMANEAEVITFDKDFRKVNVSIRSI
ncbi:type II toxin-antitoxin system VapC family toxin [bacterium]|nr:type II toxin-antitoxin system VapC family toxin [bacterium]